MRTKNMHTRSLLQIPTLLLLLVLFSLRPRLDAQIIATNTLSAGADSYVNSSSVTANFGTANLIYARNTNGGGSSILSSYLKFSLTSISNLSTATLRLNGSLFATGSVTLATYSVADTNWSETVITYSNRPPLSNMLASKTINLTTTNSSWYDLDVTGFIGGEKLAGRNLATLGIQLTAIQAGSASTYPRIQSREATTNQPQLVCVMTNSFPTVSITSPANNAVLTNPASTTITATASDADGIVTNVAFYVNGVLLGKDSSSPFSFSWTNDLGGVYSLSAVASDNRGASTTSSVVSVTILKGDSDYDGRADVQEIFTDFTNPNDPASVKAVRLGHWRFNNGNFVGDEGQSPTYSNLVQSVSSWSTNAALVPTNLYSGLRYRDIESSGSANINCRNGSIRFWFKPNWSSAAIGGTGPQTWARIIEMGGWSSDASTGWWCLGLDPGGNELSFQTHSNGVAYSYLEDHLKFNWQQGRWYQIVLTYSPTNTAIYINGEMLSSGLGIQNYPSPTVRAYGVSLGFDLGGAQQVNGTFEELETFNYPLDAATVVKEFPNEQTPALAADSDYDGRSDFLETYVDGTNPSDPVSVVPVKLGHWRFNSSSWLGEQGQSPTYTNGVRVSSSWSSNAVEFPFQAAYTGLIYGDTEVNGRANINCRNGTVRFWFKPYWSTGVGPQTDARLIELGGYTTAGGWWVLGLNPTGSQLIFGVASNSTPIYPVYANVNWASNHWYQLCVTYTPTNSALYVNGQLIAAGAGASNVVSAATRANGYRIGWDWFGNQSPFGAIDELETFNYPLAATSIAWDFYAYYALDNDLNGVADVIEDPLLPAPAPFTTVPFVVTGTIEAEQFDKGSNGVGYATSYSNLASDYRKTGLYIDSCDDRGAGYCVTLLKANDWMKYTFVVIQSGYYTIEPRVAHVGTNTSGGSYKMEFGRANGVNGWQSSTLSLQQSGWHDEPLHNVYLEAGTNSLKLIMVQNAADGYVGRFNYISFYPTIPNYIPPSSPLTITVTNAPYYAVGDSNPSSATANRNGFQAALNALAANGGGTLYVPAGTYYLNKDPVLNPTEDTGAWVNKNASLNLTNVNYSNIEIRGDTNGGTVLMAYDRSTTVIYGNSCTNLSLQYVTIRGNPHVRPDGSYDAGWLMSPCGYSGSCYSYGVGSLLVYLSCANINVTRSKVMNASAYNVIIGNVTNMLFATNQLVFWEGEALPVPSNQPFDSTNGYPNGQVGIFGSASASINIVVVSNYFNGNPAYATNSSLYSSDGIVWFQDGGNWFVARNEVLHYGLEAVQFGAGPSAAVGNRFVTGQKTGSTAALVAFAIAGYNGLSSATTNDNVYHFVGNYVNGGRSAYFGAYFASAAGQPYYNLNLCGNDITVSPPPNPALTYDGPSSVAYVLNCGRANIAGNILRSGNYGFFSGLGHLSTELHKNDFTAANQLSLVYLVSPDLLEYVSASKNILSSGSLASPRPYIGQSWSLSHVKVPFEDASRVLLIKNLLKNGSGNTNTLLTDPRNAPVNVQ